MRCAEIPDDTLLGSVSLVDGDHGDRHVLQVTDAAEDSGIVPEPAVPVQFNKTGNRVSHEVGARRALAAPRCLYGLIGA